MKRLIKKASALEDVKELFENSDYGNFSITDTNNGFVAEGVISLFVWNYYTEDDTEVDSLHVKIVVNNDNSVREFIEISNKWYENQSDVETLIHDLRYDTLFEDNDEIRTKLEEIVEENVRDAAEFAYDSHMNR